MLASGHSRAGPCSRDKHNRPLRCTSAVACAPGLAAQPRPLAPMSRPPDRTGRLVPSRLRRRRLPARRRAPAGRRPEPAPGRRPAAMQRACRLPPCRSACSRCADRCRRRCLARNETVPAKVGKHVARPLPALAASGRCRPAAHRQINASSGISSPHQLFPVSAGARAVELSPASPSRAGTGPVVPHEGGGRSAIRPNGIRTDPPPPASWPATRLTGEVTAHRSQLPAWHPLRVTASGAGESEQQVPDAGRLSPARPAVSRRGCRPTGVRQRTVGDGRYPKPSGELSAPARLAVRPSGVHTQRVVAICDAGESLAMALCQEVAAVSGHG